MFHLYKLEKSWKVILYIEVTNFLPKKLNVSCFYHKYGHLAMKNAKREKASKSLRTYISDSGNSMYNYKVKYALVKCYHNCYIQ